MSEGQNTSNSLAEDLQANPLKRKRQLLPLGTPPPPQLPSPSHPAEQRTTLRVNRACNACRRQKMRCDGPDKGAPCSRCQHSGTECVFEKVPNKPPVIPPTRITVLEAKLETLQAAQLEMNNTLQEILAELKKRPYSQSSGLQCANSKSPPTPSPVNCPLSPCHTPSEISPSESQLGDTKMSNRLKYQNRPWEIEARQFLYPHNSDGVPSKSSTSIASEGTDRMDETDNGHQGRVLKPPRLTARQVLRDEVYGSWNSDDPIKDFQIEDLAHADPVQRGVLSEQEARELFTLFFDLCHPRMPIFDLMTDTFDSIRNRSSLCFCCILMCAAKARDGGNPPSDLQTLLWEESIFRAKQSMFQRVTDLEVIQSLILLSAWSESTGGTCWIVLGHAIRCGVETGIQKALTRLASGNHTQDQDKIRILVASARIWSALFAFEYQLSFGLGRHTMTGHPRTIKHARKHLLSHPFSHPLDQRLVYAAEIMILEYEILEGLPSTNPTDVRLAAHLQDGCEKLNKWEEEWLAILTPRHEPQSYLVQCLYIFKNYAVVTIHMAGMGSILTAGHFMAASNEEKRNCYVALSAAKEVLRIATEMESYRDGLQYSPTCFYGGVAFIGTLILRFGAILEEEDQVKLERGVVKLWHILQNVPTDRFQYSFQNLLREKNLIS